VIDQSGPKADYKFALHIENERHGWDECVCLLGVDVFGFNSTQDAYINIAARHGQVNCLGSKHVGAGQGPQLEYRCTDGFQAL
jgi:hypothetical protein